MHTEHYASQVKWIGYLSSTSVYGDWGGAWVDERSGYCKLIVQCVSKVSLPLHGCVNQSGSTRLTCLLLHIGCSIACGHFVVFTNVCSMYCWMQLSTERVNTAKSATRCCFERLYKGPCILSLHLTKILSMQLHDQAIKSKGNSASRIRS